MDTQGSYYYVDFLSPAKFRELYSGDTDEGTYTYMTTGANTAALVLAYDAGDRCDHDVTFRTETSGDSTEVCDSGTTAISWQTIDRP